MAKVVTMGEIMLRLSTPGNEKFIQADEFDVCYGGGEANVAVSLANYGHDAEFVTKVPDNPIGECAVAALRKMNVKTDNIAKGGERLGIYFLESGASMRASNVVYDRAHSSISTAEAADFDFDKIFDGADWFHFTGITPAVSDAAAELTEEALKAAKAKGVKVSVDLNFRKKLWSSERLRKLCQISCSMLTFVSETKKTLKRFSDLSRALLTLHQETLNLPVMRTYLSRWLRSSTLSTLSAHCA